MGYMDDKIQGYRQGLKVQHDVLYGVGNKDMTATMKTQKKSNISL